MLRIVLSFIGGAACGFGAATLLLRERYKTMVDEEVKSAMDWVKTHENKDKPKSAMSEVVEHSKDAEKYNEIRGRMVEEGVLKADKPRKIPEEDFVVDDEDFDKVSLDYYTDGEALYNGSEYIPNTDEIVGDDNLEFLLSTDDSVIYVRNEKLGIDYEVCKINGRYSEFD